MKTTTKKPQTESTGGATYPAQEVCDDDESEALGELVLVHVAGGRAGHRLHLRLDRHEDSNVPGTRVNRSVQKII